MKIIDFDKNGNVIPDITKVVLPPDLSVKVWERMNPGRKAVPVCKGKPTGSTVQ